MSKIWKWILGIVLVLVVLGALGLTGFFWQARSGGADVQAPFNQRNFGPLMNRGDDWNRAPMMGSEQRHPMMNNNRHYQMTLAPGASADVGGSGFYPFGGFFLLGGLVKFALFVGLLYGAYWLGRRNARIALDPKPVARGDASAAPEADPVPAPRKRAKKVE